MKFFLSAIIAFGSVASVWSGVEPVDYLKQIKPLLSETCYRCHGVSQQKSGLRLDTAAFALKGGDNGPAYKAGHSSESLLIQAVLGTHPDLSRMPYKKPPLTENQIALLKSWIDQGAPAPSDEHPEANSHWAFVPPRRAVPPDVAQKDWIRNPIDCFILARLEKEKIKRSPEADRITLIRRLSFDLIGLPPTIPEVECFVNDSSPEAYNRLVERLLASPHYGERWARHWLDVARYADSNGYSIDAPRSIWKYRDWVIEALNRDLPFDQFAIEQLAGDLLPDATIEQKIATGFHRNTSINEEGGIDKEQFRIESIVDRVNTTGTAFLGLTIGCAQCHDHKFDPIAQKEYYQLFAFLNNADEPILEIATPAELARRDAQRAEIKKLKEELKAYADGLDAKLSDWETTLTEEARGKLKAEILDILKITADQRDKKQKEALLKYYHNQDSGYQKLNKKIEALEKKETRFITTMVMRERTEPRETHVHIKGDFTRKGERVTPGVLAVLHPMDNVEKPTRLDLAKWIVDPQNPLTARVTMNRLWQQYFGKGLVGTENDFGTQGAAPTHLELLDWLATELVKRKWSLKAMHRQIVTSATYRQSSRVRPELATLDPNNKLLARQSRLRLDAEIVRDLSLAASGLFADKIGGPSVYPPQPDGVMTLGQSSREWKANTGPDRYRRAMYTFFWRATPHPLLMVFDAPDGTSACTRRMRSNTPLQALTLLNDQGFYEFAQGLAARVVKEAPANDTDRINYAFQLCLSRNPSPSEKQRLEQLLEQQLAAPEQTPSPAANTPVDGKQLAAWTTVSRVLLNLDETITRE